MGTVYKARDLHLDRSVAVKILPAEAMAVPEPKRRLVQEAKAASVLNSPNVIQINDINSDAGVDFIATEYAPGKTLDQRIKRKGRIRNVPMAKAFFPDLSRNRVRLAEIDKSR